MKKNAKPVTWAEFKKMMDDAGVLDSDVMSIINVKKSTGVKSVKRYAVIRAVDLVEEQIEFTVR